MPIIKYKTGCGADKIEQVEVLRETNVSVFLPVNARSLAGAKGVDERRDAKRSTYAQYHDTWEDAKAYLMAKAEGEVVAARRRLEQANSKLGNIKGMKPPKEAQ